MNRSRLPAPLAALMIFSAFSLGILNSAQAQERQESEFYNGTNKSAYVFRKCSMQLHRHNGSLVVVTVADSKNVYNIWMDGREFNRFDNPALASVSGSIALDHKNRQNGVTVYSTKKVVDGGRNDLYSLLLEVDIATQKPLSFELQHFDDKRTKNSIRCLFEK